MAHDIYFTIRPGDEIRGFRPDVPREVDEGLSRVASLLSDAAELVSPPIGHPDERGALVKLVEAEGELVALKGLIPQMPRDVVQARADALRLVDRLTGRQ